MDPTGGTPPDSAPPAAPLTAATASGDAAGGGAPVDGGSTEQADGAAAVDSDARAADGASAEAPTPRRAPGNPLAFFGILAFLYVGPGALSQLTVPVAGLAWSQLYVFLVPAIAAAAAWNLDPRSALLLRRRPSPPTLLLALLIGLVGFVPAGAVMALVSLVLPHEWIVRFDLAPLFLGPAWQRIALSLLAAVLAPLCEEAAFRGQMLTLWRARLRPAAAIVVTSFLFALLHLDPVRFVAVFLLGILFGWLAWRSGSLWPAVIAHAANNATAAALVGSVGEAATQREQPDARAALMALVTGALFVAPLLMGYARVTPVPQPVAEALVPLDDAPGAPRFALRRISPRIVAAAVVGLVALAAIVAVGLTTRAGIRTP